MGAENGCPKSRIDAIMGGIEQNAPYPIQTAIPRKTTWPAWSCFRSC